MRSLAASRSCRGITNSSNLVSAMLIVSLQFASIASAFVPTSRTLAKTNIATKQSCLYVLSPPPPSPPGSSKTADGEDKPSPLFSLDGSKNGSRGGGIYQVEEQQQQQELQQSSSKLPQVKIMPAPFGNDPDDFSFYYRDEDEILTEREDRLYTDEKGIRRQVEKCILVGVEDLSVQYKAKKAELYYDPLNGEAEPPCFTLDESMVEMRELIRTAGMEIAGEVTQRLQEVNPKTYVGSGKVQEAKALMEEMDCSTIVFDAELTPGQQKALENIFNRNLLQNDFLVQDQEIKVVDRTALILDIFAQHARTREGKLQVDLALHEYRKPRLTKMWTHLERQSGAGGVGLRGPGESQLEIDKRLVRDRIITLKKKIDDVQKQRTIHRRGRKKSGLPILSLVGYTNAGKSSVLNYLTRAGVMAESMLFATLDPTTRKVKLPGDHAHPEFLLTDTVGFIQKLPTNLVAAFRATLEEVEEADVLVHVIDVSNPSWEKQERAVRAVLADLGCGEKPILRVLNKIDLLNEDDAEYLRYEAAFADNTVVVSALYGDGMEDFMGAVEESLNDLLVPVELLLPYSMGQELSIIHDQGVVETIDYRTEGTYILGRVPPPIASRLEKYVVSNDATTTSSNGDKSNGMDWTAVARGRHNQQL
ncbi:GTP-binding protein [Nitzschia inconspicua]|uniref:GTP-binding protein n=1 Tax=Nitzschia inconspicua TaxID=303405 RepID=A0A9K3PIR2_9STRA|nr:GTP-binding protein [Nitzschia inconspicua]